MESSNRIETKKNRYAIKSVEKALVVMEALSEIEGEVNLSQLSKELGMSKSFLFRLLATFEQRGYVEQEKKSGKYRVGLSAYEVGQKFLLRMELLRKTKPLMQALARECNEAVYLAIVVQQEVLFLEMVDTAQQVKIIPLVGKRYPLHQTSAGKIFLAFNDGHDSSTASGEMSEELSIIKQRRACFECGGFGTDISSLAVPVFNAKNEILGSLCILGPDFRIQENRVEKELLPRLKTMGRILSSKMGYLDNFLN